MASKNKIWKILGRKTLDNMKHGKLTIRDYVPHVNSTFTTRPHKTSEDGRNKKQISTQREFEHSFEFTRNIRIQNVNSIHTVF